jgi:hypothetical protein
MPPHVKVKKVHGCRYWWNNKKKRWGGLINNATHKFQVKKVNN